MPPPITTQAPLREVPILTRKNRQETHAKVQQEMIRALQPNTTHQSRQNQEDPQSQPRSPLGSMQQPPSADGHDTTWRAGRLSYFRNRLPRRAPPPKCPLPPNSEPQPPSQPASTGKQPKAASNLLPAVAHKQTQRDLEAQNHPLPATGQQANGSLPPKVLQAMPNAERSQILHAQFFKPWAW